MSKGIRCRLGWHKWVPDYSPGHRICTRCGHKQYWVDDYQNSGWEGSDFEPAHWVDLEKV